MKRNILKKLCILMACLSFSTLVLSACESGAGNGSGGNSSTNNSSNAIGETNVWSTYSTVKVTRNVKNVEQQYYDVLDPSVTIEMMKGEVEGTQLIITAGKSIANYDLILSDLSDGKGNTISKNSIAAYHQRYMLATLDYDSDGYLNVGDYIPDMLLPLETAKEYGENKIKAGENQGITVEVETTSATVPGIYTGTFVLDLAGNKRDIPVSITVWDIEYTAEKSEYQSSFLIYKNHLMFGEYDSSVEKAVQYAEFMLKYNANAMITGMEYENVTAEQMVEYFDSMSNDKNFNSVCMPYAPWGNYTATSSTAQQIITFIVDMAKLSTPEKPWIEWVYCYPMNYDEIAPSAGDRFEQFLNVFAKGGPWDQTREKALEEVKKTDEYRAFDDDFKARVDEAILTLPAVNPTSLPADGNGGHEILDDFTGTICPVIDVYGNDAMAEQAQEHGATMTGGNLWMYSCINPCYPYPTFHTTDRNLGNRIMGWHSKKWDVTGFLYFNVNMYKGLGSNESHLFVDPYETDVRQWCPGDGFLLYPGRKYGSEYPFASLRLVAYRDTVDDYDMLTIYEHLLEEKAEKYGIKINFNDYVEDLYDTLFEGTQYYTDDSLVVEVRRELARRIIALKSDAGLMISQKKGVATIYSTHNSLKINGENKSCAVSGSGYVLKVLNDRTTAKTINITAEGYSYNYTIYAGRDVTFNGATANATSSVSVNGSYAVVVLKAEAKANDGQTLRFKPYVEFNLSDMSNADNIQFEMDNTGDTDIETEVYLILEDGSQLQLGSIYIIANGERTVRLNMDRRKFTDEILAKVKKMRFTFANVVGDGTATLLPDKSFVIDNVFIELNKQ